MITKINSQTFYNTNRNNLSGISINKQQSKPIEPAFAGSKEVAKKSAVVTSLLALILSGCSHTQTTAEKAAINSKLYEQTLKDTKLVLKAVDSYLPDALTTKKAEFRQKALDAIRRYEQSKDDLEKSKEVKQIVTDEIVKIVEDADGLPGTKIGRFDKKEVVSSLRGISMHSDRNFGNSSGNLLQNDIIYMATNNNNKLRHSVETGAYLKEE